MSLILITLFVVQFFYVNSLVYTIEERMESCNNGSKPYFDLSTINFTMVTDTETVVNGKMIFLETVGKAWRAGFYGERYDRGQWNLMLQKKMDDFCDHILNPMDFWYIEMNKFLSGKQCPYEKGFEINFDNFLLDFKHVIMPPHWLGRWRITVYGSLINNPGYYECYRYYADVHDM